MARRTTLPSKRARAAGALVRQARWERAQRLRDEREAQALAAPKGRQAPGHAVTLANTAPTFHDVRTTSLWFGTRFELRDQTLFDHATGWTYSMALADGVPWDEAEICHALVLMGAVHLAHAFIAHSAGRPPTLRDASAAPARPVQPPALIAAPKPPPEPSAPAVRNPGQVSVAMQRYLARPEHQDRGHPPPFGNRQGSTSL